MANEEHLAILRRGVEEWNRWRKENPEVTPDLHSADLADAQLNAANLADAKLNGARLVRAHLVSARLRSARLFLADLTDAHLFRASLIDARLVKATLVNTDLTDSDCLRTHFNKAKLVGARLVLADLYCADFGGAELTGVNFDGANLIRANFVRANLAGADFFGADIFGAQLTHARLRHALFGNTNVASVNLREVKDLETALHELPSPVTTNTLELSYGQIPESFLKGCGLSDWEIEAAKLYNPKLDEDERNLIHYEIMRIQGEQPIMHTRLFISYSHGDTEFVEALEPLLDDKGVRYWRDVHDMRAGRIETQIDRGITLNPLVLLILSENSVRSDWVEDEATKARELERQYRDQGQPRDVLCPIALDDSWKDSDWRRWLRRQIEDYHVLPFSGWRDPAVLKKQFGKLYEGMVLNYKA